MSTATEQQTIVKGSRVVVYENPINLDRREGVGTVKRVLRVEDWCDRAGRPIVRCMVRFDADEFGGNEGPYERDVSELAP